MVKDSQAKQLLAATNYGEYQAERNDLLKALNFIYGMKRGARRHKLTQHWHELMQEHCEKFSFYYDSL